ncbi:MAG: aminoglycoside phosphotransferase family protein [Myxococcota bacterium]
MTDDSTPIPRSLADSVRAHPDGPAWLTALPENIAAVARRWSLQLHAPFDTDVTCSWVARCSRKDGTPAVLKLGMPHMEARDEIAGLRLWDGAAAVHLLEADEPRNAMLLEACVPGTRLRERPEAEQDRVLADLLARLWRPPPAPPRRPDRHHRSLRRPARPRRRPRPPMDVRPPRHRQRLRAATANRTQPRRLTRARPAYVASSHRMIDPHASSPLSTQ